MKIISYELLPDNHEQLNFIHDNEEMQVNIKHEKEADILGKEGLIKLTKKHLQEN